MPLPLPSRRLATLRRRLPTDRVARLRLSRRVVRGTSISPVPPATGLRLIQHSGATWPCRPGKHRGCSACTPRARLHRASSSPLRLTAFTRAGCEWIDRFAHLSEAPPVQLSAENDVTALG